MILNSLYRRRSIRRRSRSGAAELAARRLSLVPVETGAWRTPPQRKEIKAAARASARAMTAAVPEPPVEADPPTADGAASPITAESPALDRERLTAAGYLDAGSGKPCLSAQLKPLVERLIAQAFAPDAGRRGRLILVSSPGAGEGKSLTAIHLALALSHDGGRPVLLIDGDPQTAGTARGLGLAAEPGLTDALGERASLDQLVRRTGLDDLAFLASGRAQAAMTGLLASQRMAHLARELLARRPEGLVVIDGPPLLAGTEAAALALFAGQVVLLVAAGRTSESAIAESLRRLGERANLWPVLTRTPAPDEPRGERVDAAG